MCLCSPSSSPWDGAAAKRLTLGSGTSAIKQQPLFSRQVGLLDGRRIRQQRPRFWTGHVLATLSGDDGGQLCVHLHGRVGVHVELASASRRHGARRPTEVLGMKSKSCRQTTCCGVSLTWPIFKCLLCPFVIKANYSDDNWLPLYH